MANTIRDSTVYGSEEGLILRGSASFSSLDANPHISTAGRPACQEEPLCVQYITKALLFRAIQATETALALHSCPDGSFRGSTVGLLDGNLVGQNLLAVSIYPERSLELESAPTWRQILTFILNNLHLLEIPNHALGTWFDKSREVHVLDIVICLSDRTTALSLGLHCNQTSIYDLSECEEIPVTLTGDLSKQIELLGAQFSRQAVRR